ncbi:MAG: hypothetical protein AB7N65_28060, partial [Vicinamibacterales bacterium]
SFGGVKTQTTVGETRLYHKASSLDASQHITAAAKADSIVGDGHMLLAHGWSPDKGTATVTRPSGGTLRVDIALTSSNPLFQLPFALNSIDYELQLTVDFVAMTYRLVAAHDGFPNYEVYLNRLRIHDHPHGSSTPADLLPPLDITHAYPFLEIPR